MFTITCVAIICVGACYSGFHAWSIFHEIRTEHSPDAVQQLAARPVEFHQPTEDLVFGSLTYPLAELLPESSLRHSRQSRQLAAGGFHARSAWANWNAVRLTMVFASIVMSLCWLLFASPEWETTGLMLLLVAPVTAWALPGMWLDSKAGERTAELERSLPDVIDLLNMAVSQGLTVPSTIFRIAAELRDTHPAMAQELSIVKQQAKVGSLERALDQFAERFESESIKSFVSLLIQSQTTGTSLVKTLSDYSDNFRSQLRQRIDAKANEASFKLLFPTTLCLLPAVFLFLLGPAIVDISAFVKSPAPAANSQSASAQPVFAKSNLVIPLGN